MELEQIQQRTAELKGEALSAIVESSEVAEFEEGVSGVSELETELSELALAEAEQSALGRKREAEERLRSLTGQDIGEHLAEPSSGLAAVALVAKAEEIDALKDRMDQRFAERRTSVLRLAI